MPRIARVIAVGYPHHVTQRGNNRTTVFFDDEDRQTYLRLLIRYSRKYRLQIWAYCLMGNHVHLLVVPKTDIAMSRGIGLTNMTYTQYLNNKLQRSGRIWQNRFFSCVVGKDSHLWAVAGYIERNPTKAGLVQRPEEYSWSSAKAHISGTADHVLSRQTWLSPTERGEYAEYIGLQDKKDDDAIRQATRSGRPFASEDFVGKLETLLGQCLHPRKPGRPIKTV